MDTANLDTAHEPRDRLPGHGALHAMLTEAITRAAGQPFAVLHVAVHEQNEPPMPWQVRAAFDAEVARRLAGARAEGDLLAHQGGAEFTLVLACPSDAALATVTCLNLTGLLEQPVGALGRQVDAGCCIGIALYPRDGSDPPQLLAHAQLALDAARTHGRGRHEFYTAQMSEQALQRRLLESALQTALARAEFQLLYQPVADLRTGEVCAAEALLRWHHPAIGLLEAGQFVDLADEGGLSGALAEWVLRHALSDLRRWEGAGAQPLRLWLNLSGRQLRDRAFGAAIAPLLEEAGIAPDRLAFALRERSLAEEPAATAQALARLRALGVGLVLDDFGAGVSSLSHTRHLPLDLVKIDAGLTQAAPSDPQAAAICHAIVAMAHALGIEVAAEGVDTAAHCEFVRAQVCDLVQGGLVAGPLDAAGVAALLRSGHSLPAGLLRIQRRQRTLLVVDDEPNILSALKRVLRRDGYHILAAGSGQEALELLAGHDVDVIVSDQRMPGMLGAELLHMAKELYPHTLRIMLSGYTELQSVTNAVNEGAIYKFLTKPWDDELLRAHIAEAFRLKEIADENERLNLQLRTAVHELAAANRKMEQLLQQTGAGPKTA